MNRTGKTNSKKGPDKDYNAFKEFFDRETEAHVIANWMVFTGMENIEDSPYKSPVPSDAQTWTPQERYSWLDKEIDNFLKTVIRPNNMPEQVVQLDLDNRDGFTCRSTECDSVFPLHSARVRHEVTIHPGLETDDGGDHDRDRFGCYKCRNEDCRLVFTTNATRLRHEKVKHKQQYNSENADKEEETSDKTYNYHNARLQCDLLFYNLTDAVKEGDGYRLVRCYKLILLLEYKYKHTKYAYLLLHFFANIYALLSKKQAFLLIHNRFLNKKGKKNCNIPLDLHMEHLNLDLKKLLKSMGGKITEAASQRCARSISVLNKVIDSVYTDCNKSYKHGYHKNKNCNETVARIASDLLQGRVFHYTPHREGHPSFKQFKENIIDVDYRDLFSWGSNHFKQMKAIYETQPELNTPVPE